MSRALIWLAAWIFAGGGVLLSDSASLVCWGLASWALAFGVLQQLVLNRQRQRVVKS